MSIWKGVRIDTARWPSGGTVSDPLELPDGRVPVALGAAVSWTDADVSLELEIEGKWLTLTDYGTTYLARVLSGGATLEGLDLGVVQAAAAATRMRLVSSVAQATGAEVMVVMLERMA